MCDNFMSCDVIHSAVAIFVC